MFVASSTFFPIRRSNKQARLHMLKLCLSLVSLSVCLIVYSNYMLHSRCSGSDCGTQIETRNRRNIAHNSPVNSIHSSVPPGSEKVSTSKVSPTSSTIGSSTTTTSMSPFQDAFSLESNKASLDILDWLRKMARTADLEQINPVPILAGSRRFLLPCSKDEFTVSQSLQDDKHEGEDLEGFGSVEFPEESICYQNLDVKKIIGTFKKGMLEGEAIVEYSDRSFMKANFKHGVLHGLVRKFWCKFGPCDLFEHKTWQEPLHLREISWMNNGKRENVSWEFKIGGGMLAGTVDNQGDLSGQDIVYIYPDLWTCLHGEFEKGVMVRAQEARLTGLKFVNNIALPTTQTIHGSAQFHYEQSNKTHMTSTAESLHLRDPYENQYLTVGKSSIEVAGRGVFLKKDVAKGTILGFYNGVRMSDFESKLRKADRKSPYRMDNDWASPKQVLNIPVGFREPHQYNATFGHWINHSRNPNAWYAMIDHPRFGKIRSVVAMKDLKRGTELFCDYGFLDQYMQSQDALKDILGFGKGLTQKNDEDFNVDMKNTVNYLKNKVNDYKPYLDMFKTVYNMINK